MPFSVKRADLVPIFYPPFDAGSVLRAWGAMLSKILQMNTRIDATYNIAPIGTMSYDATHHRVIIHAASPVLAIVRGAIVEDSSFKGNIADELAKDYTTKGTDVIVIQLDEHFRSN